VLLTLQAFVLGLVQGVTEFLPVSSSGHLQAVPYLLGWDSGSLAFDVAVHVGTLVAVVHVFRADLVAMLGAVLRPRSRADAVRARRLVGVLAVASVPAGLVGLLLGDAVEAAFDRPLVVAAMLVVTAGTLWWSERRRTVLGTTEPATDPDARMLGGVPWRTALAVGAAQAAAVLPGLSRSGATISAGLALGLSRAEAARLSFLMLIPVTLGAAVLTLPDLASPPPGALPFGPREVAVGVATSAVSGVLAIRFLLALVARRDLLGFARYVLVLAAVLVVAVAARG
jgi:undecaprenyl-diphosphatase